MAIKVAKTGRIHALVLSAVLTLLGGMSPATVIAAAPPPLLDPCLNRGAFNIADDECYLHRPAFGAPYGPIAGVTVVTPARGSSASIAYPGGSAIDFINPTRPCGDIACPHNTISWRNQSGTGAHGHFEVISGCTQTDITCELRYHTHGVGDGAEGYTVWYGEHYDGIYPVGTGRAFAFYEPPLLYPVVLDVVDVAGERLSINSNRYALAIREGTNPVEADCVAYDWFTAVWNDLTIDPPDCIKLRWNRNNFTEETWLEGVLPNNSGDWTIIGSPAGSAALPLLQRGSPYRRLTVHPADNDIRTNMVRERRPTVNLNVTMDTPTMNLGSTQTVTVVAEAVGGDVGSLSGLTFSTPNVLAIDATPDTTLQVVGVTEAVPSAGFGLAMGASRTFHVQLRAIGLGAGSFRASISGTDDIGGAVGEVEVRGVTVVYSPPPPPPNPPGPGPAAPNPPVIQRALDLGPGTFQNDLIQGYVVGTPNTTVYVSLASSVTPAGDTCPKAMSGAGVTHQGSFPVDIAANGFGTFADRGRLDLGWYVYGVVSAGPLWSGVGNCERVHPNLPYAFPSDITIAEGTGAGTTAATFTISLAHASTQTVTVQYSTAHGTAAGAIGAATSPADFAAVTAGTVTFAPGETSKTVAIQVVRDAVDEPNERFFVNLSNPVNAVVREIGAVGGDFQGVGTITDDDGGTPPPPANPTVRISDVKIKEGTGSGLTTVKLTVTLSAVSTKTVKVRFGTANGTVAGAVKAALTTDYVAVLPSAASSLLTFAPGESSKVITLKIRKDSRTEPSERFFVNLSGAVNATLVAVNNTTNDLRGIVTIQNDD